MLMSSLLFIAIAFDIEEVALPNLHIGVFVLFCFAFPVF